MLEIYLTGVVLVWVVSFLANRYLSTEHEIVYISILSISSYIGLMGMIFLLILESDIKIPEGKYQRWFKRGGK